MRQATTRSPQCSQKYRSLTKPDSITRIAISSVSESRCVPLSTARNEPGLDCGSRHFRTDLSHKVEFPLHNLTCLHEQMPIYTYIEPYWTRLERRNQMKTPGNLCDQHMCLEVYAAIAKKDVYEGPVTHPSLMFPTRPSNTPTFIPHFAYGKRYIFNSFPHSQYHNYLYMLIL